MIANNESDKFNEYLDQRLQELEVKRQEYETELTTYEEARFEFKSLIEKTLSEMERIEDLRKSPILLASSSHPKVLRGNHSNQSWNGLSVPQRDELKDMALITLLERVDRENGPVRTSSVTDTILASPTCMSFMPNHGQVCLAFKELCARDDIDHNHPPRGERKFWHVTENGKKRIKKLLGNTSKAADT